MRRQIVEMIRLNFTLDGTTLVPEWRKPFDVLAEGLLVSSSRGDKTPIELFIAAATQMPAKLIGGEINAIQLP